MGERSDQIAALYEKHGGNVSRVAREAGVTRATVYYHLRRANVTKPLSAGRVRPEQREARDLPRGGVRRFIVTCAQNNTPVHGPVLENLEALASHYGVADEDFLVASFTYNVNAYGRMAVKRGSRQAIGREDLWYDPAIEPRLDASDREIELAPGLVWCGRMNTLPTAGRPLSGFETYTGRRSGIFPHAKLAMQSVASGKHEPTKFNYTTGTITKRNYIQKRAGILAEHHHVYGGLLVEVTPEGNWYVRQLNADGRNRIFDLGVVAEGGRVEERWGETVEAVNWGDVHAIEVDPMVRELAWGKGGMMDTLQPRHQFMHDLISFIARNHHEIGNPHKMFERHVAGLDSVEQEMRHVAEFLHEASRPGCRTVVVNSNHDNMLERWLREADYRRDPLNALFFLRCQLAKYEAIARQDHQFMVIEHVLRGLDCPKDVRFLREDESFVICRDSQGGIECGAHGHLGPDGSRGSPQGLSRMGRRANTGHTHSAGIIDGLYTAGTSSRLDLGYNVGPSSWSHSHIVTYTNGKRALVTMWEGGWRA